MLFLLSMTKKGLMEVAARPVLSTVLSLPPCFWNIFGIYVWVHARTFGSQPECNAATKVIFFGKELSATGSGRVVCLGE